jgi:hypothetical protein
MTTYRFYMLGDDGKIRLAEAIDCLTDDAALEAAERRLATCGHPAIEVWDRGRRVGTVGSLKDPSNMAGQIERSGLSL